MIKLNSLDKPIKLAFNKLVKIDNCWDSMDIAWDVMSTYKSINNLPMYAQYYIFDILQDWDNKDSSYENEEYKIITVDGELYITEYNEDNDNNTNIKTTKENNGMIVGYVRVSTIEQNEGRQLVTMEKYNVEKVFSEKISAKDTNREQLKTMLDFVREGDTIVIHDFSRLARSTKDLLEIFELLQDKKVNLVSAKENIDSSTPTGKLMLTMIAAINEFERTNLLERQKEGIAIAKQQGKYKGRKKVEFTQDQFEAIYNRYKNREINKANMAKELQVSRPTLDKLIKEYLESHTDTTEVITETTEVEPTETTTDTTKDFKTIYNRYLSGELTKTTMAIELGVSRPTLNKLIEKHIK